MGTGPVVSEFYGEEEQVGAPIVKFYRGKVFMDPIERAQAIESGFLGTGEPFDADSPDWHEDDFIRISYPGNRFSVYDQPIKRKATGMGRDDLAHPERFPREWEEYQGRAAASKGTPLTAMESLNEADRNHLDKFDVRSVEALAGLSDIAVLTIGNGISRYRDIARTWMRANVKPVVDENAQVEINDLKAQLEEMRAMIAAMAPAKRGRPAKIEDETDAVTE